MCYLRVTMEADWDVVKVEPEAVLRLKEAFSALGLDFERFKAEYAANT